MSGNLKWVNRDNIAYANLIGIISNICIMCKLGCLDLEDRNMATLRGMPNKKRVMRVLTPTIATS